MIWELVWWPKRKSLVHNSIINWKNHSTTEQIPFCDKELCHSGKGLCDDEVLLGENLSYYELFKPFSHSTLYSNRTYTNGLICAVDKVRGSLV